MKIFKKAIKYKGEEFDVHHTDTNNFDDLEDKHILKAHAVCFWDKKMVLVNHSKWNVWSIPGGTRELNESVEETLHREILEETNCKIIDLKPISYQKIISSKGEIYYRAYYICNVKPVDKFINDPAGRINKIIWIDPKDFEKYIEKKPHREIIIKNALKSLNLTAVT